MCYSSRCHTLTLSGNLMEKGQAALIHIPEESRSVLTTRAAGPPCQCACSA